MGSKAAAAAGVARELAQVPRRRRPREDLAAAVLTAASNRRHSLFEFPTRLVDYGLLTTVASTTVRAPTTAARPPSENWSLRRRARRHPELLVATEPLGRRRFAGDVTDSPKQSMDTAAAIADVQDDCVLPSWMSVSATTTSTANACSSTCPWTVPCQGKRAYVVSAFEQSLANMAQRLQSLTVSAAQKDSELQELRQLIDSMRQDRSTDSAVSTMASSMHAVETSPTTCSNFQQHEGGGTMGRHGNASPTHSVSIFSTDEPHSKCSDLGENSCHTLPPGSLTPGQCAKKANWLRSSFCKAFKKKGSQTSLLLPPESSKSDSYRWGDGFNSLSRSSQAGGEKLCSPPMDSRFKGSTANTPLNGTACRMLPVSPSNSSTSSSSWSMQGPIAGRRPSQSSSHVVKKTSSIPDEITRKAICEFKSPDHHRQQHEKASSEKPPRTDVVVSGDRVTASGLSASDKEIDQLRRELADRETKLTEVQLQALASAHQVDQLRDQMTYMFEELTLLRTENEQLQRLSMQLHSAAGSNKSLPRAADQQLLQLTTAGAGSACGRNCCANSSGASSVGSSAVPSAITPQLSLNSSSYSHVSPDQ